jgi:hypothetical protein
MHFVRTNINALPQLSPVFTVRVFPFSASVCRRNMPSPEAGFFGFLDWGGGAFAKRACHGLCSVAV